MAQKEEWLDEKTVVLPENGIKVTPKGKDYDENYKKIFGHD